MTTRIQPNDFPESLPDVMTKMGYNNVLTGGPTKWYDQASMECLFSYDTYCAVPSNGNKRELYNLQGVYVPPRKEETTLQLKRDEPVKIPVDDAWLWVPLRAGHATIPTDFVFTPILTRPFWVVGDVRAPFACACNDC